MVCNIQLYEKPALNSPVLIEGLPGIGFVANIAVLHLIQELKAKLFGEIRSSSFQDFAITAERGKIRSPINELYFHKGRDGERDLILLYGNTQALTTPGQYELCGRILDIAEELGCRQIITLGGLKREGKVDTPGLYCAASDLQALHEALRFGAKIIRGHIFGVAGLLIGLGKLRGMRGLCLLAETPGYPDASAAREVLNAVCKMLQLKVDLARLDTAAEATRNILESFGLATPPTEKKAREKPRSRWLI
ncbi:MAG: PAC2 family protein [Candidatus Bathyarchaeia archaeon]